MNPISSEIKTGTVGELLTQIRLLQYEIQAAQPLKDSGNDLIAVRNGCFKAIQVKTRTSEKFTLGDLPLFYHLLAIVSLVGEGERIDLDESRIYLLTQEEVSLNNPSNFSQMKRFLMTPARVSELFAP